MFGNQFPTIFLQYFHNQIYQFFCIPVHTLFVCKLNWKENCLYTTSPDPVLCALAECGNPVSGSSIMKWELFFLHILSGFNQPVSQPASHHLRSCVDGFGNVLLVTVRLGGYKQILVVALTKIVNNLRLHLWERENGSVKFARHKFANSVGGSNPRYILL